MISRAVALIRFESSTILTCGTWLAMSGTNRSTLMPGMRDAAWETVSNRRHHSFVSAILGEIKLRLWLAKTPKVCSSNELTHACSLTSARRS